MNQYGASNILVLLEIPLLNAHLSYGKFLRCCLSVNCFETNAVCVESLIRFLAPKLHVIDKLVKREGVKEEGREIDRKSHCLYVFLIER